MRPTRPPRAELLGMRFDPLTFEEAIDALVDLARRSRGSYAVTANVDHLVRFVRCPDIRALYDNADLVVADGMPLIWASRILGVGLPERVAGSDLMPGLCARAAAEGLSVFLLGGDPGSAELAAKVLQERHPALRIAGTHCPPFGFEKDAEESKRTIDAVRTAQPDILFVGLGSPKQEKWIVANREVCGAGVSIGVGITFSFLSGQVRRAPRWMQRTGLEWAHRLFQEPGRLWRRYLIEDTTFFWLVFKAFLRRLLRRRGPS